MGGDPSSFLRLSIVFSVSRWQAEGYAVHYETWDDAKKIVSYTEILLDSVSLRDEDAVSMLTARPRLNKIVRRGNPRTNFGNFLSCEVSGSGDFDSLTQSSALAVAFWKKMCSYVSLISLGAPNRQGVSENSAYKSPSYTWQVKRRGT